MTPARRVLVASLLALAALYAIWFGQRSEWVAVVIFGAPPLAFAWSLLRHGAARTAFWAGVIALLWFSHGVMVAFTRPPERIHALAAVALSLLIVFSASIPGLRARFSRSR
jgi:uncharacterized membrane protein